MRLGLPVLGLSGSGASGGASSPYSAEADAYFAAMSVQPDATRKTAIDAFITGLIDEGIWAELDWIYLIRSHDSQAARVELKSPGTRTATVVGSPTFTTDRGYTGVPSTGYLNTGWDPATNGVNYTQNDCCFGGYLTPGVGTVTVSTSASMIGGGNAYIRPFGTTTANSFVNSAGQFIPAGTVSTRVGLTVAQRTGASLGEVFRNGVSLGTDTDTSAALGSTDWFLLCRSNAGTPTEVVNNQIGLALAGGSLTALQHAALNTLWDAYLAATP